MLIAHAALFVNKPVIQKRRKLFGGRFDMAKAQSTYFTVRGKSYFSRLPKYWPPIPLSARRVCPPPRDCPLTVKYVLCGPKLWRRFAEIFSGFFQQIKVRQQERRKDSIQAVCRRMMRLERFFLLSSKELGDSSLKIQNQKLNFLHI